MHAKSLTVPLFTLFLAGCAAGPDFQAPAAPTALRYLSESAPRATAAALGEAQRFTQGDLEAAWWRRFGAARLDALVERALAANPGLEAAEATLRQARHLYEARAGASQSPQAGLQAGARRQGVNGAAMGQPAGERVYNLYSASVAVSYDLDLAGGQRRALEGLAAQVDYRRLQLEGARLSLAGNVVAAAIAQARLGAQIESLEKLAADQEEQLVLVRRRLELGAAQESEALALRAQLESTRAGLPPLRREREANRHLLALLAGQPPAGAEDTAMFTLAEFTLPADLPLRPPAELTRRRPDVRAAEALLAAASAQRGEAVARLYPSLALSADLGSQALTASSLFGSGSLVWGLAGQLAQPLFKPGLGAEKRAAEAGLDAAAARYRETALKALGEVADGLRALEHDAEALAAQAAAEAAAQRNLELTRRRHALGAASHLDVLAAGQLAERARLDLITARARRLTDTAALFQALGGGWSEPAGAKADEA